MWKLVSLLHLYLPCSLLVCINQQNFTSIDRNIVTCEEVLLPASSPVNLGGNLQTKTSYCRELGVRSSATVASHPRPNFSTLHALRKARGLVSEVT